MMERRRANRRRFTYYLKVVDETSLNLIGYIADINDRGFKLDCTRALPVGVDFHLRIDLTSDISNKGYIVVVGKSRWCKPDVVEPNLINVGFELVRVSPGDTNVYNKIVEKYSSG